MTRVRLWRGRWLKEIRHLSPGVGIFAPIAGSKRASRPLTSTRMRKFGAAELREFLAAVDARLNRRDEIVVLGGGSLALGYDDRFRTTDVDLYKPASRAVHQAWKLAQESTGFHVSLASASVGDVPYCAEERLVDVLKLK